MQIKLSFISNKNIILPIHYNNILQGFIYNNMDERLAEFLHEKGFEFKGRNFKFFSFSRILTKGVKEGRSLNFGKSIDFVVSSPLEEFCQSISNNMLFSDRLRIGRNYVRFKNLEVLDSSVEGNSLIVSTLSPIVTYSTFIKPNGKKYTQYFRTSNENFYKLIRENLLKKYNIFYKEDQEDVDFSIELIGEEMTNLVYYKKTIVKGISGKFRLEADKKILDLALSTGLGSKNSQGFGLVQKQATKPRL